ncbi:MAG: hypothetical protein ABIJ96_01600 [Elusimicrobiota bacterium]
MIEYLKSKLFWILVGVSVLAVVVFGITTGRENIKTTYARLAGFSSSFGHKAEQALGGNPAPAFDGEFTFGFPASDEIARLIPHCVTAAQVQAILAQHQESCRALVRQAAIKQKSGKAACGGGGARKPKMPAMKQRGRAPDDTPKGRRSAPRIELTAKTGPTPDEIRDVFETDLSKFPLNDQVRADGVTLKIGGISRWNKGYIVKVEVTNEASTDFFIKESAVSSATGRLVAPAFPRHFVEKGKRQEGYIAFPRPETGARLQIEITGEGEKLRTLSAPVKFPF